MQWIPFSTILRGKQINKALPPSLLWSRGAQNKNVDCFIPGWRNVDDTSNTLALAKLPLIFLTIKIMFDRLHAFPTPHPRLRRRDPQKRKRTTETIYQHHNSQKLLCTQRGSGEETPCRCSGDWHLTTVDPAHRQYNPRRVQAKAPNRSKPVPWQTNP